MGTFTVTFHGATSFGDGRPKRDVHPSITYLGMAREFHRGAHVIATNDPTCGVAMALLTAQGCENALKAWLARSGKRKELWSKKVGHQLEVLWNMAVAEELVLPANSPPWFGRLAKLHGGDFDVRYSENKMLIVTPDPANTCAGLVGIIEQVTRQLNQLRPSPLHSE